MVKQVKFVVFLFTIKNYYKANIFPSNEQQRRLILSYEVIFASQLDLEIRFVTDRL